ncbi:MAG TPA: heme-copper oxidase subunit III [Burkholderiaceae bacterium]|nr:heme-copper oxidase subunit III [Burkholderiaceae bacterium]HMX09956.1 heme-copper oxidase subunit III [Burkholderiaceae bacterium]HMY99744.1 heme-copper oxidase subunit III [Burkholderiaceae bacterium]HNB44331.1 heme-copper oxidase subunit III [Burkholderiaceae bacterium]HNG77835.1 heme-copper oxidase subunit III [Burkholderiaceae bacterium]
MSHDAGAAHGDHAHGGHWEWSMWPAVASLGILALALAFSFHFVYHNGFAAVIALGIGVVMILAGVAGWTSEAMGHGEGLSFGAMGWFILAEAMIFVSFLAAYWFLRLESPFWPPEGTPEIPKTLPLIMTVVLVSSSFTMHHAEALLHAGNQAGFRSWLLITLALGATFLGMSAYEWNHLIHGGFNIGSNVYGTFFFSITGFHGGHVIVGLSIFLAGLPSALRGQAEPGFWRTAGLYWHFVDIIWFFVVSQVYFW